MDVPRDVSVAFEIPEALFDALANAHAPVHGQSDENEIIIRAFSDELFVVAVFLGVFKYQQEKM